MSGMASCYWNGRGTKLNIRLAMQWWKRAALHGSVDAMTNLGRFYRHGYRIERDRDASRFWFTRAVKHGDKEAYRELQEMEDD